MTRIFACIAALAAGLPCMSAAFAQNTARPNFVIIMSDDHVHDQYGFIKPDGHLTPSLNQLRNEGTYFTNFYVASTVCQPSRYSLFTGCYPSRGASAAFRYGERYTAFNTRVSPEFPSLAHGLKSAGYQTGFVGKIGGYNAADFNDDRFNGNPQNDLRILEKRMASHGYTYASSVYKGNLGSKEYHNMEWLTMGAMKFMEQAVGDQDPFCLVVCPTLLHDNPYPSLNRTVDGYADAAFGGKLTGVELAATQAAHARGGNTGIDYSRQGVLDRAATANASAALLWLDDAVGALLQKTKDLGVDDKTYFIYFSDHGDDKGAKGDLYQPGTNMPFLVRYPGGEPGTTNGAMLSEVDIMATVYDLAGADLPGDAEIDGISFRPVLEDPTAISRDAAYSEIGFVRTLVKYPWKYMAFRIPEEAMDIARSQGVDPHSDVPHDPQRDPKSIFASHFGNDPPYVPWESWFKNSWNKHDDYFKKDQLYNLANDDPDEQDNLAYQADHQAKLTEMKAMMADIIHDLPGSFHEFKFEAEIDGATVTNPLDIQGDLDLSYPFNVLSVAEGSNLTRDSYTLITYGGSLTGTFSRKNSFQAMGYDVDYSEAGKVKLVKDGFAKWKQLNGLSGSLPANHDGDGDGVDLIIEYAMDISPAGHSPNDYLLYEMDHTASEIPSMQVIYRRLRPELTYTVQWSTSLEEPSWSSNGVTETELRRDLVKATVYTQHMPRGFLRLVISE